jgi:hypothetical protein
VAALRAEGRACAAARRGDDDGARERPHPAHDQRGEDDPRMPAILEDEDWPVWLGEEDPTPGDAKGELKTMEGVNWTAVPEAKGRGSRKA